MLFRALLAGLSVVAAVASTPEAVAQSQNDIFVGAPRLSPDGLSGLPSAFYASITSHGGKYVLGNSTKVMATVVKPNSAGVPERVNDGLMTIPSVSSNFQTHQMDFLGSQTPSGVNRVYLKQLTDNVAGCAPCFTIHRTIEQTSGVTGQLDWTLGTLGPQVVAGETKNELYLGGKEVLGPDGITKALKVGTPVWQRRSSPDQPRSGGVFSNNRLVLKATGPASSDWQIAELDNNNTLTGNILQLVAFPNEVFGLVQMLRSSDWYNYKLVPAANANAAMSTFEVRRPNGIAASVPITIQGKPTIDKPLYNIDINVTVKSRDMFAGMAGIMFTMNANPITSLDERYSYPGFIAFVPRLPERLGITVDGKQLLFPQDYNGSFPGLLFGIRGATGSCTERGMLDYPSGVSEFLASSDDKTGAWMVCVLPWWWETDKPYRIRLWAVDPARSWGAWVSNADGKDGRQIGTLAIPPDPTDQPAPRIAGVAAFVSVGSPQACDKVGSLEITVDSLVADAGQQALAFGAPSNSASKCPGLKAAASCSGAACTLGVQ